VSRRRSYWKESYGPPERRQSPKRLLRLGTLAAAEAMSGRRPSPETFRKGENAAFEVIRIADPQAGTSTHKHRSGRYSHGVARIAHRSMLLAKRLLWAPASHRPEWAKRLTERDSRRRRSSRDGHASALRRDQQQLQRAKAALRTLQRGGHVPNLTLAGARHNVAMLRRTIANKRKLRRG